MKLIELDAALEGLENLNAISFYEANEHSKEAYTEIKDMLKALPTVQPFGTDTNVATTDTISRQDAINAICEDGTALERQGRYSLTMAERKQRDADILEALPSAQQWIPCKERLPEDYTDVLVWFEYYRYGDYNRLYQMHGIGNYMSEYDSWMINHETGWRKLRVFAWMPLPEPWKGDKE